MNVHQVKGGQEEGVGSRKDQAGVVSEAEELFLVLGMPSGFSVSQTAEGIWYIQPSGNCTAHTCFESGSIKNNGRERQHELGCARRCSRRA